MTDDALLKTPDVPDSQLIGASHIFFPDAARVSVVPGHSDLVRVDTPQGTWRVRRWPAATPMGDIVFSHAVMATARGAGLAVVAAAVALPESQETVLLHDRRLYDAQPWLSGTPPPRAETEWPEAGNRIELPVALPVSVFGEVITAAAMLHRATSDFTSEPDTPTAPLALLPGAVQQAQRQQLGALRARAPREPAIQRWLAIGERLIASASPLVLHAADDSALPATAVHLALWPSHILSEHESLSGLLGWERAAIGSPLLDLAQSIVRLQGWTDEHVETAIGIYSETRPLSPVERRLLPAVAALDVVASTGRLLEQTYAGGHTDRPPTPIRAAIDAMLRSMTNLDRTLSTPAKPRRRVWRRGPAGPPPTTKGASTRDRQRPRADR